MVIENDIKTAASDSSQTAPRVSPVAPPILLLQIQAHRTTVNSSVMQSRMSLEGLSSAAAPTKSSAEKNAAHRLIPE
jgi:hypothetical protein